jgi:hypothetical protein
MSLAARVDAILAGHVVTTGPADTLRFTATCTTCAGLLYVDDQAGNLQVTCARALCDNCGTYYTVTATIVHAGRLSFAPLTPYLPADTSDIADLLGVTERAVQRYRRNGIPVTEADRFAIAAGVHPDEIWGPGHDREAVA